MHQAEILPEVFGSLVLFLLKILKQSETRKALR